MLLQSMKKSRSKGGEMISIDFFFETENGISVSSVQSYIIYYGIICLIFIPSILFGKRAFCHYLCWMAPFMILGIKLRRILRLPGIHIRANKRENCPKNILTFGVVERKEYRNGK
ncbi:MAG: hypothetical protein NC420_08425 [Eubacterium sp.]|nr:hypothetical protein [Eubacterium sp.]